MTLSNQGPGPRGSGTQSLDRHCRGTQRALRRARCQRGLRNTWSDPQVPQTHGDSPRVPNSEVCPSRATPGLRPINPWSKPLVPDSESSLHEQPLRGPCPSHLTPFHHRTPRSLDLDTQSRNWPLWTKGRGRWVRSDRGGACGRAGVRYRDLRGKAECVQSRALWVRTPGEDAPNQQDHSKSTWSGKGRHAITSHLSNQLSVRSSATSTAVSGKRASGQMGGGTG